MHLSLSEQERTDLALRDVQLLHPEVNVREQFLEAFSCEWANTYAGGIAFFFPGQVRGSLCMVQCTPL